VIPFSRRIPAHLEPNRISRRAAELRHAGAHILDLTASNPTAAGFDYRAADILVSLGDPRSLTYTPQPRGLLEARLAVAGYYAARGISADASRIFLTSSTSESYSWIFKLLCDAGDNVLVPRPSYPLFECLAHLDAVEILQYPLLEESNWAIDLDALAAAITPRSRAVILVHPNNPTGSYLPPEQLAPLAALCARHDLALISDEVFLDYAFEATSSRSLLSNADCLTFALGGLSKFAGLPQMKLGWIAVNSDAPLERLEWIADSYLPVSAPVQHAAPRWLAAAPGLQRQILERCRTNYHALAAAIPADSGARLLPAAAGWTAILELPRLRSEEDWVLHFLDRASVLLQPGYFYDFQRDGLLVASLLPPPATFNAAVRALANHLYE
jgi:alanine-synthesizing transaminase